MSRYLAIDVLSKYINFSPADVLTLEKAFAPAETVSPKQLPNVSRGATVSAGNVLISPSSGIELRNPETGFMTINLQRDGDAFFGADLTRPAYTSLAIFSNTQYYNKEKLGAGDVLLGDNSADKPNLHWDRSEGTLNFRSGQDTKLYIDTVGDLILTGRIASANYANAVSGFEIDAESGDAEFNNVNLRGSLTAVTFVYDNRHALGGTLSLTKAASTFYEDTNLNATDVATSNCKINNDLSGNSLFVLNDNAYVSFWNGTSILSGYIEITSVGANQGEYTVYELTARTGAVGGNTVPADTPVSNYGQTGDSRILLIGGANANINFSEMTTTRVLSARGRFGDLDGVLGISSTTWGFAVGDLGAGSKKYFKATASEVALRGASFATYDSGGVASMYIVADDSRGWGTETLNAGDVCIGYPGTTSYMLWDRSAGILYFKNSSKATQLYVHATDGTLRGGSGGVLKIGSSGISLSVSDSFYQDASYNFTYSDVVIGSLAALHQDLVGTTINLLLSTTKYAGHDCYVSAYADCATTRYSVGTFGAYYNTTVSTSAFMQSTASSSSRTIALKIDNTTELTAYAGYIGVNSLHVGGTSDPGDDNLIVDGLTSLFGNLNIYDDKIHMSKDGYDSVLRSWEGNGFWMAEIMMSGYDMHQTGSAPEWHYFDTPITLGYLNSSILYGCVQVSGHFASGDQIGNTHYAQFAGKFRSHSGGYFDSHAGTIIDTDSSTFIADFQPTCSAYSTSGIIRLGFLNNSTTTGAGPDRITLYARIIKTENY